MNNKLSGVKAYILDLDGTLYLGDRLIDGAADFINTLRYLGLEYVFLTNNSSKALGDYVKKLQNMGFPCEERNVMSTSVASAEYIRRFYPGKKVFPLGTEAFIRDLEKYGTDISFDSPDIVLAGYDRELTYKKVNSACAFLRKGCIFLAANPDFVCPMPGGEVEVDCGSICAMLTASSGAVPEYIGKPGSFMPGLIAESLGLKTSEMAFVGDRLYTDIKTAVCCGAVSVCVLSGETDQRMIEGSDIKPDIVLPSVKELSLLLKEGVKNE